MKLNLGCGTVIFPIAEADTPAHIKPEPPEIHDGEWVNIDKYKNPGVNERIDLFRYPWLKEDGTPFADNSVEFIYCSHIIEHIPHEAQASIMEQGRVGELDGFFEFFAECWRILKPGGELYIAAPYALSIAGLSDPTHTRYITPATFGYLCEPLHNTPFDYHLPLRFEMVSPPNLRFTGEWVKLIMETPDITPEQVGHIAATQFNACDEVRVRLRACAL